MTIDREEMIAHFSAYGDVTGISMNPTRGYAFIDYRNNECVQTALRYTYITRRASCLFSSTAAATYLWPNSAYFVFARCKRSVSSGTRERNSCDMPCALFRKQG